MFKAPRSLAELHKLNTGIDYGFSQIGKFITIYPPSTDMAVVIASDLHRLTANFRGPVVPYDNRLRNNSCVYYRYGGFSKSTIMFRGKEVEAIARPDGKFVQDRREPRTAVPSWISAPWDWACWIRYWSNSDRFTIHIGSLVLSLASTGSPTFHVYRIWLTVFEITGAKSKSNLIFCDSLTVSPRI